MKFSTLTWISWLGATLVAAVTLCTFAYSTFQTKDQAREDKRDIKEIVVEIKEDVKEIRRIVTPE